MERLDHLEEVVRLLKTRPVVAVLGARQVGKTTLARQIAAGHGGPVTSFDLEDPRDQARLAEPMLALEGLRGLVVLDEIQLRPDLFALLRVLADRPRKPARFLILGSASLELLQQGSESLAGRVAFHDLGGFDLAEVGSKHLDKLWVRGGFPTSFLARTEAESVKWRADFIRTFLERDLPQLGIAIAPATLGRFWTMLAHYHAQVLNASELGRALGVSHTTIRHYLDLLTHAFVVRQLQPWSENIGKRVVKSPKVYIADSGLVHALLQLPTRRDIEAHPKVGASWEGFLIAEITRHLRVQPGQAFFWATQAGAELDLLIVRGKQRLGFEIKRTDAPRITPSMRSALADLKLTELYLVHAGSSSFDLAKNVHALAAKDLLSLATS
jgi:predicted AAA+ superfamily ATPase